MLAGIAAALVAAPQALALADGRAYELVTPGAEKRGGEVAQVFAQVAPDGDAIAHTANNPYGDATHGMGVLGYNLTYRVQRTPTGWVSDFASGVEMPSTALQGNFEQRFYGGSSDLSTLMLFVNYAGAATVDPPGFTSGVYGSHAPDELVPRLLAARPSGNLAPYPMASSSDGRHVIVATQGSLPLGVPPAGGPAIGRLLYESVEGDLRLVNLDDGGSLLDPDGANLASDLNGVVASSANPVSRDGSHIFFLSRRAGAATDEPRQLHVRVDGDRTIELSAPTAGVRSEVRFAGASADGTRAFFTARMPLTPDASGPGPFLYQVDLPFGSTDPSLTVVGGVDHPVTDSLGDGGATYAIPQVVVSDNGARAYYLSPDDGGTLLVYDAGSGQTRIVADGVGDLILTNRSGNAVLASRAEVSPDGLHLVFTSDAALVDGQTATGKQVYLYDDSSEKLSLASTGPSQPASGYISELVGDGSAGMDTPQLFPNYLPADQNFVSDDGRYVFFMTRAALVPEDSNRNVDVYRWRDGAVALVSDGLGRSGAYLIGASADGETVFFGTTRSLVPQDGDGAYDIYAARVGGGFPISEAEGTCSGDACQGRPTRGPEPLAPASGAIFATGDRRARQAPPRLGIRPISGAARRAFARTGRLRVRLVVRRPGRVRVVLRARVRGAVRRVGARSRRIRTAGATSVTVRLSRRGRRALARRGRMRLGIRVTSPVSRPQVRKLTLRKARR